jgi:hypothetical protein
MSSIGHHIDRNTAHRVPEATYALRELLQHGDERAKPGLEREVTWRKQSAEQGQSLQFDQSLHRPSDFSWFSHSRQYQLWRVYHSPFPFHGFLIARKRDSKTSFCRAL